RVPERAGVKGEESGSRNQEAGDRSQDTEVKSQEAGVRVREDHSPTADHSPVTTHHSPARVSLCIIAKNEEHNLADCLKSASPIVDEIVVVDTGSSDRTKEIALGYGARVFDFRWVDSFAAARNESLQRAT